MLFNLRMLAILEGISLLTLLFVAMPLKYFLEFPQAVTMVGWVHGVLFMVFIFYSALVAPKIKLPDKLFLMLIISSMLPFGMVFMDKKLKKI